VKVSAYAKVNLALVVGPTRPDGLHELTSVVQRVDLADDLELEPAEEPRVAGFPEDTLVRAALDLLAAETGRAFAVTLTKRIPVAAGLGGGSADAGAVLAAASEVLDAPLPHARLVELAAAVGADVPFFLEPGPKLVEGAGERLTPLELPQGFWLVIALPHDAGKASTGEVFARFDAGDGPHGYEARRSMLLAALARCREPSDLVSFPPNDLAHEPGPAEVAEALCEAGAFRADTSGAGPAVYGLFERRDQAELAALAVERSARVWALRPVW
jgi:4-diphosphocytidyl-2-C-methyl-D-erythritol kinase